MDWITLTREEIESDGLPPACMECGDDAPVRVNRTFGRENGVLAGAGDCAAFALRLLPAAVARGPLRRLAHRTARVSCPFCKKHADHWERPRRAGWAVAAACLLVGLLTGVGITAWVEPGPAAAALCWSALAAVVPAVGGLVTYQFLAASRIEAVGVGSEGVALRRISPLFVEAVNRLREADPPTEGGPPAGPWPLARLAGRAAGLGKSGRALG